MKNFTIYFKHMTCFISQWISQIKPIYLNSQFKMDFYHQNKGKYVSYLFPVTKQQKWYGSLISYWYLTKLVQILTYRCSMSLSSTGNFDRSEFLWSSHIYVKSSAWPTRSVPKNQTQYTDHPAFLLFPYIWQIWTSPGTTGSCICIPRYPL